MNADIIFVITVELAVTGSNDDSSSCSISSKMYCSKSHSSDLINFIVSTRCRVQSFYPASRFLAHDLPLHVEACAQSLSIIRLSGIDG